MLHKFDKNLKKKNNKENVINLFNNPTPIIRVGGRVELGKIIITRFRRKCRHKYTYLSKNGEGGVRENFLSIFFSFFVFTYDSWVTINTVW